MRSSASREHAEIKEMADLPIPLNGRYIGECIYCGAADELTTEHAVPYALNGPWTLLEASCRECCDLTHRFERDTIHGLFPAIRAVFRMQTRRKTKRPVTLPLLVVKQGEDCFIQVPLNDFPLFLPIITLPIPGVVEGRPWSQVSVRPSLMLGNSPD